MSPDPVSFLLFRAFLFRIMYDQRLNAQRGYQRALDSAREAVVQIAKVLGQRAMHLEVRDLRCFRCSLLRCSQDASELTSTTIKQEARVILCKKGHPQDNYPFQSRRKWLAWKFCQQLQRRTPNTGVQVNKLSLDDT